MTVATFVFTALLYFGVAVLVPAILSLRAVPALAAGAAVAVAPAALWLAGAWIAHGRFRGADWWQPTDVLLHLGLALVVVGALLGLIGHRIGQWLNR